MWLWESSRNVWVAELELLPKIAKSYPQAAYYAFTSAFRKKFSCVIRTIPNISHPLQPLKNVILQEFIISPFKGATCNDLERQLLSLPVKLGGMDITNITSISDIEHQTSKKATKSLVDKIKNPCSTTTLWHESPEQLSNKFISIIFFMFKCKKKIASPIFHNLFMPKPENKHNIRSRGKLTVPL